MEDQIASSAEKIYFLHELPDCYSFAIEHVKTMHACLFFGCDRVLCDRAHFEFKFDWTWAVI